MASTTLAFLCIVLAFMCDTQCTHAQSQIPDWERAAGGKTSFDVASVKQDNTAPSSDTVHTNVPLGPMDSFTPTGGFFSATNQELLDYIIFAYKLTDQQTDSVSSQLPRWADTDRYDIEARAEGNPTKDQYRLMMQTLLSERFKLALHYESKQMPVLALVLDKPGKLGPQIRPHVDDIPCATTAQNGVAGTIAGGFPVQCGVIKNLPPMAVGQRRLGARAITTVTFANMFSMDKPVVDRTGLEKIDFVIEFSPDTPARAESQPDPSGPTFLEALKDQLGLKLEQTTAPVQVAVVDHIEEPSSN